MSVYDTQAAIAARIALCDIAEANILASQELSGPHGKTVRANLRDVRELRNDLQARHDQLDAGGSAGGFTNKVKFQDAL